MVNVGLRRAWVGPATAMGLLLLAGCATQPAPEPTQPPPPVTPLPLPPSFQPSELVGRWGYASYARPGDLKRTEDAARRQCGKPVTINRGPTGGVMMYLADQNKLTELQLKGGPGNKTYLGPGPDPAGGQDREVVSFDGRVLVLRWLDPEVQGRYGNGVYVRCAPRA